MATNPPDSADTLSAVQRAIEHGDDRRSPLYRWMLKNHDTLAAMFRSEKPNWGLLTQTFTDHGFRKSDGTPMSKEVVRQLWIKAKRWRERYPSSPATVDAVNTDPASKRLQTMAQPVVPELGPSPFPDDASVALDDLLGEMNKRSGRSSP